jgi:hypothetical protein
MGYFLCEMHFANHDPGPVISGAPFTLRSPLHQPCSLPEATHILLDTVHGPDEVNPRRAMYSYNGWIITPLQSTANR